MQVEKKCPYGLTIPNSEQAKRQVSILSISRNVEVIKEAYEKTHLHNMWRCKTPIGNMQKL